MPVYSIAKRYKAGCDMADTARAKRNAFKTLLGDFWKAQSPFILLMGWIMGFVWANVFLQLAR